MEKYRAESSLSNTIQRDDSYNTRQHAFNIGLAYMSVCIVVVVCTVIGFKMQAIWLLRGILASLIIDVGTFAKSLVEFTGEARDIQWKNSMAYDPPVQTDVGGIDTDDDTDERGSFPSPRHRNGMLFVSAGLSETQRHEIAATALQHQKLTVNYLTSIGLKREDAERLREELVGHGLLMFNERNEAVITDDGCKSFGKVAR